MICNMLPTPDLTQKRDPPWCIRNVVNIENTRTTKEGLEVTFKKGKWSSDSGMILYANPFNQLPATHAIVSCSVYVPKDFPWTISGKFCPGFSLGCEENDSASGGDWDKNAGSVRVSWFKEGPSVSPYIYLPTQVGDGSKEKTLKCQSKEFEHAADTTDRTGIHMWREKFRVHAGKWNDIALEVKLNDPDDNNGMLKFTVNDISHTCNGIRWRNTSRLKINQVVFAAFFGGSSSKYAPRKETTLTYTNFKFGAS